MKNLFKNLKKEIKIVKWPTKKVLKEDIVVVLCTSSIMMLAISIINLISKNFLNLLF